MSMRAKKNLNDGEAVAEFHKGGSVCAKGRKLEGTLHGHWEWFRPEGTLKRSGWFDRGVQVGNWTTYEVTMIGDASVKSAERARG